jgi:hypothetical protein
MAMRDLVGADCGGANALVKLTSRYAKDQDRHLIDQGIDRQARGAQFQHGKRDGI